MRAARINALFDQGPNLSGVMSGLPARRKMSIVDPGAGSAAAQTANLPPLCCWISKTATKLFCRRYNLSTANAFGRTHSIWMISWLFQLCRVWRYENESYGRCGSGVRTSIASKIASSCMMIRSQSNLHLGSCKARSSAMRINR
jgi:hypothetical protein